MKQKLTHRGWVTGALLLSTFMTAIEITIVATAMPRIVADLGGFALLSWVFSSYLLTQVVSIPIYGKLADLYGRKPVFLSGMIVFLIASVLCGQSSTMMQLIFYRFLQGIGGGAVQPIAVTIIGDLYTTHERHKVQGWIGSVFAISSIAGPALGAFIVDLGHWPWIFYLNIPLGIGAFLVLSLFLHEEKQARVRKIDYLGAIFLILGTASLMMALMQGGTVWPWTSWKSMSLIAGSFFSFFLLLAWEKRAFDPIIPFWIFRHRLIAIAGIATFLNGAIMIGYSAMIPTHVQGVLGQSALIAGATLAGMSIGWPTASFTAGYLMKRVGYRRTAIFGSILLICGSTILLLIANASAAGMAIAVFIVGMGLGYQSNAYIITIQSAVPWRERGVATANNIFMRTLGSSVGVAAFGGILNSSVVASLQKSPLIQKEGAQALDLINRLLEPTHGDITHTNDPTLVSALSQGMITVFTFAAALAAVTLIFAFLLPKIVSNRDEALPNSEKLDASS